MSSYSCSPCSPAPPALAPPGQLDPACGCCLGFVTHRGLVRAWPPLPSEGRLLGWEALGRQGGAAVSVSPRTCGRGHGNDSTGEGLGFKNNHLGSGMASWPHQLC